MIAVRWGGSEKVIQYCNCHPVNSIDDCVVSRLKISAA